MNANAKNQDGRTVLCEDSSNDNIEVLDLLIKAGADVNMADAYGNTPLQAAEKTFMKEIVQALLNAGAN
jgi:ankyrin repeat protein